MIGGIEKSITNEIPPFVPEQCFACIRAIASLFVRRFVVLFVSFMPPPLSLSLVFDACPFDHYRHHSLHGRLSLRFPLSDSCMLLSLLLLLRSGQCSAIAKRKYTYHLKPDPTHPPTYLSTSLSLSLDTFPLTPLQSVMRHASCVILLYQGSRTISLYVSYVASARMYHHGSWRTSSHSHSTSSFPTLSFPFLSKYGRAKVAAPISVFTFFYVRDEGTSTLTTFFCTG